MRQEKETVRSKRGDGLGREKYDWQRVREEYVNGGSTLSSLAEKYGIPKGTVLSRSGKEGWGYMKRKYREDSRRAEDKRQALTEAACDGLLEEILTEDGDVDTERFKNVLFDGLQSRQKLLELREISEVLTKKISEAVFDEYQFNRYLVSEKGTDENGKPTTLTSEKCFDKLDTKAIKEMTNTLKVLTECVRSLYGIPTFGETSRLYLASRTDMRDDDGEDVLTVSFLDGEEYSE